MIRLARSGGAAPVTAQLRCGRLNACLPMASKAACPGDRDRTATGRNPLWSTGAGGMAQGASATVTQRIPPDARSRYPEKIQQE